MHVIAEGSSLEQPYRGPNPSEPIKTVDRVSSFNPQLIYIEMGISIKACSRPILEGLTVRASEMCFLFEDTVVH